MNEEAIEKYQKATEIEPDDAWTYFYWGNALGILKRYDEAIEKYQRAKRADSDYAYAYHNIASLLWTQGRYKESLEEWEQARDVYQRTLKKAKDSIDVEYFENFGDMLHGPLDHPDEAEKVYKEGYALDPDHVGILMGLVDLYLEQKDEHVDGATIFYWKAREKYRKAEALLQNRAQDASDFLRLGTLQLIMEEYKQAEKNLSNALKQDEESSESYANLGVLCVRKEQFKRAISYFEDSLRRDPDDLTVRSNLAEAYLKQGLLGKAEVEYKKILDIAPCHVESQIGMGEVYVAMGDSGDADMYEEAIRHFSDAIKIVNAGQGSKRLKGKELAAVLYSRGYARVKLYEASGIAGDEELLSDALADFKECYDKDRDHHKADRASTKIQKKLARFSPQQRMEKVGPPLVACLSLLVFFLTQVLFILSQIQFFAGKPIVEVGHYVLLTFGSLIFLVTGLSLPQILKLRFAGIQLEKSSVEQITTSKVLGIKR